MHQTQTLTQQMDLELQLDPLYDFVRLPGLFRRWEFEQVLSGDHEYRIEPEGELADKTQVFAVYRREQADSHDGVPVGLTFDGQQVTVRARLLPIDGGGPLMAILVLGDHPEDAATLTRVREHLARSNAPAAATAAASRNDTARAQEGATP
jgi:hypothetical protein